MKDLKILDLELREYKAANNAEIQRLLNRIVVLEQKLRELEPYKWSYLNKRKGEKWAKFIA